jgi:ferritin-like protein
MSEYHEKWDALPAETKDRHRALKSLQEEIEAVDWYDQRIAVADDSELRAILAHNRDEEIEHAAMILEWLRRSGEAWDEELRTYLFTKEPIAEVENAE